MKHLRYSQAYLEKLIDGGSDFDIGWDCGITYYERGLRYKDNPYPQNTQQNHAFAVAYFWKAEKVEGIRFADLLEREK